MRSSICTCMWSFARGGCDEVHKGRRNTDRRRETYKDWFNLLTKPWNGIGVIRESKNISMPACPPLPLSLTLKAQLLWRKKITSMLTFLYLVEQIITHCCSFTFPLVNLQSNSFSRKKNVFLPFQFNKTEILHKQHKMPLPKKLKIHQFSLENVKKNIILTFLME